MYRKLLLISIVSLSLFSCDPTATDPISNFTNGVLVLNAGNFTDNNGTISSFQRNSTTPVNDIFQYSNGRTLAGGISGYAEALNNTRGIILVDNATAGKDVIEIVDANTFKSIATIPSTEIENPRVVLKVSDSKTYISCWGATGDFSNFFKNPGYIAVLDLNTNKITKKIPVQNGAESMVLVGSDVYVGSQDFKQTTMALIDSKTDALTKNIPIGSSKLIGIDLNNILWLVSDGVILKYNILTGKQENKFRVETTIKDASPRSFAMSADKKTIYYTNSYYDKNFTEIGQTYSFPVNTTKIEANTPFIKRLFGGGFGVDPVSGLIYAAAIPSYKQAGFVYRYTTAGVLKDSIKVGIAPSGFYFKK